MTESIRVTCLIDRYWDSASKKYLGTETTGTLIDLSVQQDEYNSGRLIPVGIVLLDNNTFQSIPLEFIQKTTEN